MLTLFTLGDLFPWRVRSEVPGMGVSSAAGARPPWRCLLRWLLLRRLFGGF